MSLGDAHLHLRKRVFNNNLEPYPHPKKFKRYFDSLMYVIGTIAPLAVLPQVFQIYVYHNVAGLSVTTWALLGTINLLWAVYGALHHERPILIANTGMCILNYAVVFGVLVFR